MSIVPTITVKYIVAGLLMEEKGLVVQSFMPQFRNLLQIRTDQLEIIMIPYHDIVEIRSTDFDERLLQDMDNNLKAAIKSAREFEEQMVNGEIYGSVDEPEGLQYG